MQKANLAVPHQEHRRGAYLPYVSRWARRWTDHLSPWRMASATPDLRLPFQPRGITALWPVPNYTAWWQSSVGDRGTRVCVWTTCLRSLPGSVPVRSRTCASEWPQDYKSGTLPLDYRATSSTNFYQFYRCAPGFSLFSFRQLAIIATHCVRGWQRPTKKKCWKRTRRRGRNRRRKWRKKKRRGRSRSRGRWKRNRRRRRRRRRIRKSQRNVWTYVHCLVTIKHSTAQLC